MRDVLDRADVVAILDKLAADIPAQAETLRELDAAIGDGDLGITVTLGFGAVVDALAGLEDADIGQLILRSGMAFNRKAASTFGALFAAMMMRAARIAKDKDSLDLAIIAEMAVEAAQGVRERGKSDVGDKTLLDALVPAAESLKASAQEGMLLGDALRAAAKAAEEGMTATKALKSKVGRSSWFAERTEGIQDPGATALYLMIASVSEYVSEGD